MESESFYLKHESKGIIKIFLLIAIFLIVTFSVQISAYAANENKKKDDLECFNKATSINNVNMRFYHPTQGGMVTSVFGDRWGRVHKGIDIARDMDTPVIAALSGVVTNKFYEADGYGNIIIISHGNGIETRYAHLNGFNVNIGDRVTSGKVIGRVGSTGRSTGPHLHFEVRVNGKPLNPERFI